MVGVGERAPDFILKDSEGMEVSLKSLLGGKNILLYFYHKDFSPVCTSQLGGFCKMEAEFAKVGFRIVAVSGDKTPHKGFRDSLKAKYTMLSGTKDMLEKYGVYMPEKDLSNRAYFVIDKGGMIRFRHVMPNPGQSIPNGELIKIVKDLKERMGF